MQAPKIAAGDCPSFNVDFLLPVRLPPQPLKDLGPYLAANIRGQSNAVTIVANAVVRAELGFSKPHRPKSVFLFLGPTGVGKTETVLLLSQFLFGSTDRIARYDMGEYGHEDSLKRLLGESRDDAGLLPKSIDERPEGGILLMDEIEKAHPKIAKVFLAATDAARITGADGFTRDLQHWYLIFTSNLGSSDSVKMDGVPYSMLQRTVMEAATRYFAPETIARFQNKIVFNSLSYDIQRQIAEDLVAKQVKHLEGLLSRRYLQPIKVTYDREVVTFLVRRGYTREMGARSMRDAVENFMEQPIAQWILANPIIKDISELRYSVPAQSVELNILTL